MYLLTFKQSPCLSLTGWDEILHFFKDYPTKDEIRICFLKALKDYILYYDMDPNKVGIREDAFRNSFTLINKDKTERVSEEGEIVLFGDVRFSVEKVKTETSRKLESFLTDDFACIRKFVKGLKD